MHNNYYKSIFIVIFILSHFLIPHHAFIGLHLFSSLLFMITFSLVITCIIKNFKDRITLVKTYQGSFFGILGTAMGISALQVCGLGVCGTGVGIVVLGLVFPSTLIAFLTDKSVELVLLSIFINVVALYSLGCFKKVK